MEGYVKTQAFILKRPSRIQHDLSLQTPSSSHAALRGSFLDQFLRTFSTTNPYYESISPPTNTPETGTLSTHIRTLMRRIPHPVVVITSSSPLTLGDPSTSVDRGMTVSSLTTVTLHPYPVFSFNIRRPSSTLSALTSSRQFLVHFIRATAQGARIADAFAKENVEQASRGLAAEDVKVLKRRGKVGGPPILASKEVMRVVRCEMMGMGVEVEDHVIILGKVVGVLLNSNGDGEEGEDPKDLGLMYVNRGYRSLNDNISLDPHANIDGAETGS
ncbi:MAG: hypothetical protein M1836_000432 [Candelina mexicana]|nr:MAG: hypothetical protein M1836_000432 [Candelina mexicana]